MSENITRQPNVGQIGASRLGSYSTKSSEASVVNRELNTKTVYPLVKSKLTELLKNVGIRGLHNDVTIMNLGKMFNNKFYLKQFYAGNKTDANGKAYIKPKTNIFLQNLLNSPEILTSRNIGTHTIKAQRGFNVFLRDQLSGNHGLRIGEDRQFGWNTCIAILAQKLIQEGADVSDKLYGFTLLLMLAKRKLSGNRLESAIKDIQQNMRNLIFKALKNKEDPSFIGIIFILMREAGLDSSKTNDRIYRMLQMLSIKSQIKSFPELNMDKLWQADLKREMLKCVKVRQLCESTSNMIDSYEKRLDYMKYLRRKNVLYKRDMVKKLVAKGDPRVKGVVKAAALYDRIVKNDPQEIHTYLDRAMLSLAKGKGYVALSNKIFSDVNFIQGSISAAQENLGIQEKREPSELDKLPEGSTSSKSQILLAEALRPALAVIDDYKFSTRTFNLIENLGADNAVYKRVEDPKYITKQDTLQGLYLMVTKLKGGDMKKACEWISNNKKSISISDIRVLMQKGLAVVSTSDSKKLARLFAMAIKNPKSLYYIGLAIRYQENQNLKAWRVVSANKGQMAYILPYIDLVNDVFSENNSISQNLLNQIKEFKVNDEQEVSLDKQVKYVMDNESWKGMMASINSVSNIEIDGLISFAFGKKVSANSVINSRSRTEDKLDIRNSITNYLKDVDLSELASKWNMSTQNKDELIDMLIAKVNTESEKRVLAIMNSRELGVLESSKDTVISHQTLIQLDCIYSALQRAKAFSGDKIKASESLANDSEETSYNANDELMYVSLISRNLSADMKQQLAIYNQSEDKRIANLEKDGNHSEIVHGKQGSYLMYKDEETDTFITIALNMPGEGSAAVARRPEMSMKVALQKASKIGLSSERAKIDLTDKQRGRIGRRKDAVVFCRIIGGLSSERLSSGEVKYFNRAYDLRMTFNKYLSSDVYDIDKNIIKWNQLKKIEARGLHGLLDVDKKKKMEVWEDENAKGEIFSNLPLPIRWTQTANDEMLYYKLLSYESPKYLYAKALSLFSVGKTLESMTYLAMLFENIYTNESDMIIADQKIADILSSLKKEVFDNDEDKLQEGLFTHLSEIIPPFLAKRLFYSLYHQYVNCRLTNVGLKQMTPDIKSFIGNVAKYLMSELSKTNKFLIDSQSYDMLNTVKNRFEKARILYQSVFDKKVDGKGYYFNKIIYEHLCFNRLLSPYGNVGGLKLNDEAKKYNSGRIMKWINDLEVVSNQLEKNNLSAKGENIFVNVFEELVVYN